jgi:tRNA(fMet)-specific endonuclease VapC
MNYLLDTNVISELVAPRPNASVAQWVDDLEPYRVYLSVVTIGELRKGFEKLPASRRKETLHDWLNNDLLIRFSGRILTLDVGVMLTWGVLMGQREREGRRLAAIDSLIAAVALHHRCCLVTRNEDDFQETGITIVNPWR